MNNITSISTASQIVFIDSQVTDYQTLAAGVVSNTEVVIIQPHRDGIEQITTALSQKPYSTVHIVSHGSPGCLYLGNSQLSLDTLNHYAEDLETWFPNPPLLIGEGLGVRSILIYGCNVAAGDAGAEFIAKLRNLTGAEIAASTTRIGNVAQGGNWELDIATKQIDSNLAFTQATQANYSGVFVTYDNNNSSGVIAPGGSVTRTFTVTDNVTISNVDLGLRATHNWRGDVEVILTSPNGTSVTLIAADAGDSFDNFDLLLTDGSTNSFRTGENESIAAPNFGEDLLAAPSNLFSAFDGENAAGTWTLTLNNTNVSGNNRTLTYNSSRLGINEPLPPNPLPWDVNPNNGGILVRGTAFLSCGTLAANGPNSPVLAVERVDIDADGNPVVPTTNIEQTVSNPLSWSHQDWSVNQIGNVYGTDIDNQGNMYAAASSNYGSGFLGSDATIRYGEIGGGENSVLAAGTVYKMDAVTGAPAVFVQLPQQETLIEHRDAELNDNPIDRTTGPGLGNIHYDRVNNQFFVSNFEDGRIYRIDSNGTILDSYDPGSVDNNSAGRPSIEETVYGLTVSPDGSQLFFGQNRTVYSIDLNSDGSLPGTSTGNESYQSQSWTNYAGATETPHTTIPDVPDITFTLQDGSTRTVPLDTIISDLDFLPTGELSIGGRTYREGNLATSYNHGGHNFIATDTTTTGIYADRTEIQGFSTNSQFGGDDGYGGIGYSKQLDDSYDYVFSSGDIIEEAGPHGLAIFPDTANNLTNTTEIVPRGAIGYGGLTVDAKGVGGDVDVFNPGSIQGNVSQDTTGDGNGETNLSGVTLTLFNAAGTTPITDVDGNSITATTDANGNFVFDNLFPGDYTVVQDQPPGLVSIDETEGGTDGDNPSGDNIVNNRISVTVDPEENDLGNDFIEAAPGTITGNVLEDTDNNGTGDTVIPSQVTITLLDSDGNVVETTDTDGSGNYTFTNVVPGDYTVVQTQPGGFVSVTPNTLSVTVTPGETDSGNNFVEEALPANIDFGDAPDTETGSSAAPDNATLADYQTTVDDGGASHIIDEDCLITIGSDVDADDGIQQNATATADDTDSTPDDEDGVFVATTNNTLNNAEVNIDASNYSVDVVVNAQAPVNINNSAANITGVAYQDYDLDGTQDPSDTAANGGQAGGEPGMGGIIVNAYDADGNLVDTTITSSDRETLGQYTLNIPANEQSQLRLEFVTPDGVFGGGNGTAEGDLIRFVDTSGGSVTDVDVALNRPEDYYSATSQGNPLVVIPCYVPGAFDGTNPESFNGANNSGEYVLVAFRYDSTGSSGDASYVSPTPIADHGQVGATYGVAYDNVNTQLFTSAFQRSNTSFGPGVTGANNGFGADGAGTIYVVPFDDATETFGAPTPYVDLNQVFGAGTVLGDNPDDTDSDPNNNYERDGIGLSQAGKTSFGDLEYYEDNLYTVNLTDKNLYAIPTSVTPDSNTIDSFAIPTPTPVSNSGTGTDSRTAAQIASDMRPFGLGVNDGKIYVGLVDSVESTGNRDYLRAYVYTFDPDTGGFSSNPIFDFDLTYTKGDPTFSDMEGNEENWQTWTNQQPGLLLTNPGGNGGFAYPQPMLADIEFDNGSLVLGLRDRNADQMGNFTFSPINGDTSGGENERRYETNSGGDILRAAPDGSGGYVLESNGSVPDGFGGTLVSAVPPNNQGPGGGEFYPFERLGQRTNSHNETALGGLTQLPGESEVLSVVFDPLDTIRSGGVARYSGLDGSINGEYQIYNEVDSNAGDAFSKSAGLGDIEALLNSAPIEVGNRIFLDKDADGIQDANEAGVAGVTVRLVSNGTEIASATTDAEGKYSFGGINAPDLLAPNTSYQIRIDDGAGTPLENYGLTLQNANSNNSDSIDSDAEVDAGNTVINFTTGDAGENNFTLDAGYTDGVTLVGWIDFNRDGVFSDTEAVALDTSNGLVTDGSTPNSLTFPVPTNVEAGPTAARFRVASGLTGDNLSATTPNGALPNGEVEDYVVNLVQLEPGSISGNVSEDNTGDGNSNLGIFNVELTLLDNAGNIIDTKFTDQNGNYSFPDVPPGDYTIVQTQPPGFISVSENEGGDDNDPGDTTLNNEISVTVESNVEDTGNDFIESQLGTITGNVSQDTDGDNLGDANLPAGIELTLLDSNGGFVETTNTDGDGNYSFTNVVPGNYTVVQSQPAGFVSVAENEGGDDDDNPGNDNTVNNRISVTVDPSETDTDNDFVEALPGIISGNVLEDTDGDGDGDAAIFPQVTLTLLDSDGNTVDTTTTDVNGDYSFTNVVPGNYTVVQTQPPGFISVSENEGGADNDPGDSDLNNRISVTVTPNETDIDNNFVEEETPSDFGDAPDSYRTNITNNGASHPIVPGLTIGTDIDEDDGTFASAAADADDTLDGNDDEDGVTFTQGTTINKNDADNSYSVDVIVNPPELASDSFDTVSYSNNSFQWAGDWQESENNDSTVDASSDPTAGNVTITGGELQITNEGRLAQRAIDLSSTTEDVILNFDYRVLFGNGNTNDPDQTDNINPLNPLLVQISVDNGAFTEVASIPMDSNVNSLTNAVPIDITNVITDNVTGNRSNNVVIRFQVDTPGGLAAGEGFAIDNVEIVENDATLVSWIDFNRDGNFDPEEGVVNSTANGDLNTDGTPTTVTWTNFTDDITSNGDTYARFRLSSDNLTVNDPGGAATDGEVEDYQLSTVGVEFDYGDAPDDLPGSVSASDNLANNSNDFPDYQTTEDDGGANHILGSGLTIGTAVDGDDGTQENPAADADDTLDGNDDEDGVDFTSEGTTIDKNDADNSYSVEVNVNVPGTITDDVTLVSWIDFNRDGEFDPEEGVVNSTANGNLNTDGTPTTVTWTNFTDDIASNGDTFARFRLSTDNLTVDDSTGSASDGEVEDYQLSLSGVQPDYGDAPDSLTGSVSAADNLANGGDDIPDYRTTETEGGPSHAQDENSPLTIGSTVDTESDVLPNATATGDDTNGTPDDEDGVFVAGTTDALNGADIIANVGNNYSIDVVVDARAPVTSNPDAVTINGVAYRDYDLDGTQKPATQNATGTGQAGGEPGIGGVTVNAYDADGNLVTSATTSNVPATLGQYTLNIPAGTESKLRLEFVAPDGLEAGGNATGEGSLNRFVDTLNDSVNEIDVALSNPGEYIGNTNPYLFTSCFVIGDQVSSTNEHVLVAYRYDGSTPDNNPIFLADADEVGSVYGLDFESNSQNIYASTYTKTHAGYGPGGAGAIYQIPITDLNNATAGTPTEYVDLNAIFGAGTVSGVTRDYGSDPNNWLRDNDGFQGVGKTSLGDLDITEDGKYIMVVNLEDKRLYAIPTSGALNSTTIKRFDIPNPNTGAREDDIRPFGLGINDGKVYVGMVDSAQSTGNRADLNAYVYEFDFDTDTATGTFTNTPVLTHDLNYDRGDAWDSRGISANWQPWQDDFSQFTDGDDTDGYHSAPEDQDPNDANPNRYNWLEGAQPMLSDIEFDNGSMILGFRDRLADQAGANTLNPVDPSDPTEYYVFQAGDILRAAPSGTGEFNVESAGSVDDGFGGTLTSSRIANNEGPGGGEFYFDNFGGHQQQSLGSLLHLPGFDETAYNAGLGNNRGGTVVVSNVDGSNVDGGTTPREILYSLTPEDTAFNKANGLGDLEALGEAAPIEVGNRIFLDKDEDGIQDANESGIAGVTLRLFSGGTEIASTTTDGEGKYSFGGVNAPDLLDPNTAYEIRIDKGTGTPIANYNLTLQNANSNGSDSLDSDAVDNAGTPTINFTTGEAGENNFTLDAGFIRGITLVGWIDFNRDGVFSDSEAVTLDTDDAQPLVTDGTTANTLEFTVPPDVEPGVTAARFRVASGLTGDNLDGTTANGALPNGEVEDYMVNLLPVFTISGTVLSDTNAPDFNAIDNPGDTPIPGVTIQLFADSDGDGVPDNLNAPLDTKETDGDGNYSFTGLTNGNYVVLQQQPGDYDSVTDIDGVDDNSIAVTINGADVTGRDFLEEKVVSIGSTVFEDTNNNGTQDVGETGISGVSVELYDPGADGVVGGSDDTLVDSQPTDNDGNYFFDNLSEGDYYVSIPQSNFAPGGALEATPLSSSNTDNADNQEDGDDNGIQANSGDATNSPVINLTANNEPDNSIETAPGGNLDDGAGETDGDMTIDFGFVPNTGIGDLVFQDLNGNGIQDPEDFGVDGVGVTLIGGGADGVIVDDPATPEDEAVDNTTATTTTSGGFYFFDGLIPAVEYQVSFDETTLPFETVFTQTNQGGNDEFDSDANSNGLTDIVTLAPGEFNETIDAGIVDTAGIGDLVFQDLNGNGIQDGSDFSVDGVGVTLIGGGADGVIVDDPATPEDEAVDNTTATTTTSGGFYFFDGLIPAVEYQVSFDETTLPFETVFTQTNQGGNDEFDSDANSNGLTDIVTLAPGEFNETIDAGIVDTAGIGDLVFQDLNGNGIQDPEDFGVDGVGVTLIGGGADGVIVDDPATPEDEAVDNTTATTQTDNGFYFFDGLIPAVEYQVEFVETTLPVGTAFTQTNQGNDERFDSDANSNGLTDIITLTPGEFNETIDAGIREVLSIGSTVFTDENDDGFQNIGEAGISGVTVQLFDSTGTEIPVGDDGIFGTADDATGGVTTDTQGNYFFDGLPEGDYRVVIPDSNFAPGGALENTPLSSHFTTINDDGFDGDDNGIQTGGIGTEVVSPVITLIPGSEPVGTAEDFQGGDADNARDANGDMTIDFGFVPKNIVTGTGGSDVISPTTTNGATAGNDFIIGGAGQDTLTGGDGSDCFHFNRTSDGIDIITDFDTNGDVLDFSDMFAPGGELAGVTITNDPITDGYVEVVDANPSTLIQVDFDPNDALFNKNVVLLENVDFSTIDASDFIF